MKLTYSVIEKETGEIVFSNADESQLEMFFAIEDIDLYQVITIAKF